VSQIVCNSGPLIALGLLGKMDILKSLFDGVFVPDAVQREIAQGGLKFLGWEDFQRAKWIRVVAPKQNDELLMALLDGGEAAVLNLAREQNIKLVLIDERKARKVARDIYGLQPIGTARILVEAKKKFCWRKLLLRSKGFGRKVIGFIKILFTRLCARPEKFN